MPKVNHKSKAEPLTPKDIKRVIFDRDDSIAGLARDWGVSSWQLRAVIYRYPEVVYPEIRERLAEYIGCDVSQVGRESSCKPAPEGAVAA